MPNKHLFFFPIAGLAGLAIAACSSTAETHWGSTGSKLPPVEYKGFHGHTMPTVPMARAARARAAQASAQGKTAPAVETGTLSYFGGKVVSSVKIQAIYWGNSGSYQAQLDPFLGAVSGDGFLGWLGEYGTNTQNIGGGSFLGSFVDTTAPSGTTIDDSQIQAELVSLINAGSVPQPDGDTIYFFFFPSGVNINLSGQGSSCSTFCGYHDTFVSGSSELYYSVLPDPATCGTSCDNQGGNTFADLTSVTTHELTEAITDPEVGIAIQNAGTGGAYPTFPNGWAAASGGSEIGDLCAWQQGTFGGYNVQLEWSDAANACINPNAGNTDGGTVDAGVDTGADTGLDGGVDGGDDGGVDSGTDGGVDGGTCAHGICSTGVALDASCDPCATQICASDTYCCTTAWDDICTGEVTSICGQSCSGDDGGTDSGTGDGGPTCDHGICTTGDALGGSCDPCAGVICASDSYCCTTAWDAICLSEVSSICGQTCP